MTRCLVLWVLAVSVVLAGCVAVAEESVRQLDQVGDVEIRTVVCASRPTAVEQCPLGNSQRPAGSGDYQLLVGYRVPRATRAPESIPTDPQAGADLSMLQSPSYTAELQRLAPASDQQKWVGYISPSLPYQAAGGEYRAALLARFALVREADGTPFGPAFRYRTVVGYRPAEPDAARPVACGDALDRPTTEGLCMDWPSPEELGANVEVGVRDVGLVAGPIVKARGGTTATVPFTFRHTGGEGAPSFTLTAGTSAPGATATPQSPTFAPPPSSASPFLVTVSLPSRTRAGTYDVSLTATLANGQTREARALLQVVRPGTSGPALALAVAPGLRLRDVLRSGLPVDAACSERCRLRAELIVGGRVRGHGRARIARAGRGVVRLALDRALGRRRSLRATIRVRATDRSGNHTVRTKRIRLR